jgi:hypothetical protein
MNVFTDFMNNWSNIFAYGLVDYGTVMLTAPVLAGFGTIGYYLNDGLNFGLKVAVSNTRPFSGLISAGLNGLRSGLVPNTDVARG